MLGWLLVHLLVVILDVHIVSNSQEFLVVFVWASKKNCSDTNNIVLWKFCRIWRFSLWRKNSVRIGGKKTYLKNKFHLTWIAAVHLCLFKNLIILWVWGLSNVQDSPSESCQKKVRLSINHGSKILISLGNFLAKWLNTNRLTMLEWL